MPEACAISYVERVERKVVMLPDYLAPGARAGRTVRVPPAAIPALLAAPGCLDYVHTSLCSTALGGPACAAVESGLDLEPIAAARWPAIPTDDASAYTGEFVEGRWFRVRGLAPAPPR